MPHLLAFVHNVTMHYVYLLKSEKNGRVYTGYTSDLRKRVTDHNSGKSPYTKGNRPYVLVYYEAYASEDDARKREQALKLRSNASLQLRRRIRRSMNES
jgi:putative endonuclease